MTKQVVNEFLCDLMCEQLALLIKNGMEVHEASWTGKYYAKTYAASAQEACKDFPAMIPVVTCLLVSGYSEVDKFCDEVLGKKEAV